MLSLLTQGVRCELKRRGVRVQVVYPALECKVQNVTHSYSVEHGEEVRA